MWVGEARSLNQMKNGQKDTRPLKFPSFGRCFGLALLIIPNFGCHACVPQGTMILEKEGFQKCVFLPDKEDFANLRQHIIVSESNGLVKQRISQEVKRNNTVLLIRK